MRATKLILTGMLGLGMLATTQATSAFAWGCYAEARDGTYGWSYNYPHRRGAERRAHKECQVRTHRKCRVIYCRRNA
jgi:hypothetical protein